MKEKKIREENKTPNELVDALIDIVSKNGNLLLNIGPKADGTITQEQQDVLLAIGSWLDIHGEGIYGTRPWKVDGEGPTENPGEEDSFNEYKSKGYTSRDVRFTLKGDVVYAFILDVPKEKLAIQSLSGKSGNGKIDNIVLLGSNEKVTWSQNPEALTIQPSKSYPSQSAVGYRITFKK